MKRCFALAVSLALAALCHAAQPLALPGTGVRMDPPEGLHLAAAGPVLVDDAGQTLVFFFMGEQKFSLESDAVYRELFKRPPEAVSIAGLPAKLYRRTRAADGGAWDGWFLAVNRNQKTLHVLATYTGSSAPAFDRLREHLLSVSWDESIADPELALGVRLTPALLRVVPGGFGALTYSETGRPGDAVPTLVLQAMPVPVAKANKLFPDNCARILGGVYDGKTFAGPTVREAGELRWCETWSTSLEKEMRYAALVLLPGGGLLNVMGTASSGRFPQFLPFFRAALEDLQPLPRP